VRRFRAPRYRSCPGHRSARPRGQVLRDLSGTSARQHRVCSIRLSGTEYRCRHGEFETMRTVAPPVGRAGVPPREGWDFRRGVSKSSAAISRRRCEPQVSSPVAYDLIVDPTNLWLTIHESIGHAPSLTELSLRVPPMRELPLPPSISSITPLRLGADETVTGDRTRPYVGDDRIDERGRDTVVRHRPRTASLLATR